MGHLPEKYTRDYFLGATSAGGSTDYGVEGVSEFLAGEIRAHDRSILEGINFHDARVFEIGYGRGEAAKYVIDHGASLYRGVDFSEDARQIASEHLARFGLSDRGTFICADVLPFLEDALNDGFLFDIVLMLDVIEHIPRAELERLLAILPRIMSERGVVVVNTPVYRHDNDVLADGIDQRNHVEALDLADFIPETSGMHCNKYTLESLRATFDRHGFVCFSRGHYFAVGAPLWSEIAPGSYQRMWSAAHRAGVRVVESWRPEVFEYAYAGARPEPRIFTSGPLVGRTLLVESDWVDPFEPGAFDERLLECLLQGVRPGDVIFDIGAYIGTHSLALAALGKARIIAFEPNPSNLDRLRQNVSANPELADLIDVVPLAIADVSGISEFRYHCNVARGYASGSHLSNVPTTEVPATYDTLGFEKTLVHTTTLDSFVAVHNLAPKCIKMDIEGAEHLALQGARSLLSELHPQLFVEVHSARSAIAVLGELTAARYKYAVLATEPDGRVLLGCEPAVAAS